MFKELLKGLFVDFAVKLLETYRKLTLQLLKLEVTKCYVRGVEAVRLTALGLLGLGLVIGLICIGLLLMHVALFILLPWSLEAKAKLGLGLGLAYVVIGGLALRAAMDERTWMEKSGAAKMLKDALSPSDNKE